MTDSLISKANSQIQQLLGQSRYRVDVHGCTEFLDVVSFSAVESLSQPWQYDVAVTCTSGDIACDTLLLKPASFTFQTPVFDGTPALPVRTIFGVVKSFRRVSTSNDETRYALTIVPRIALLDYTKGSEIYLNQSVTEVVERVLRKHGLEGPDFEFHLSRDYPARELITQWRETDLAFIQRLLAEVGIYWRYEMDSRLEQDVVIFQDSQQQYEFGVTLPLRNQAGMSDSGQESIWDTAFSGYQLLLEYFSFRPKFMFVELRGLDSIGLSATSTWFEIDIVLSEAWSSDLPFETENFRLHCAPVINLFTLEADPLTLDPLDNEYLLRPLRLQDGHTEIYSVDNIHGAVKNGKHPYVPFTSFRHRGGMMRHDAPERYFHTRVKRGPSGLYDTWLILGGRSFELEQLSDKPESLSMRITGTNGQLPRKALESTLLDRAVKAGKVPVRVLNLSAPTMPLYPPANDRFHWRVMSHLGSNFLSMMNNPEVLRGTLALYDWTDDEMNRRRLEAIVSVKHTLIRRFEKGFMLRGVDIEVTLNMDNFAGEGDVNLFGEMLHRFFALYADIHLFNQLTLVLQPTGKRLRWRENHSQHVPG